MQALAMMGAVQARSVLASALDSFVDLLSGVLGRAVIVESLFHVLDGIVDALTSLLGRPLGIDLVTNVLERLVDGLSGLLRRTGLPVRTTGQNRKRTCQQHRENAGIDTQDGLLVNGEPSVSPPHGAMTPRLTKRKACLHFGELQPSHTRALRNMRAHGESSPKESGAQLICTLRKLRSGCGIMIVKRPSAVVNAVRPSGDPLGLAGYFSATAPRVST